MKIAIAGGTGLVGTALTNYCLNQGYQVSILTRSREKIDSHPNLKYIQWLAPNCHPEQKLEDLDALVNLAGESINSGRWTTERKTKIKVSRLKATREIRTIISKLSNKPKVLINASAIGIYGTSLENTFNEDTNVVGHDFLATTVEAWEKEAKIIEDFDIRVSLMRFGIILDKKEGALPRMVLPYRFFSGGTIGSGKQWLSWIHIDDVVRSIEYVIKSENISGPINVTSPNPVQMTRFGQTIAHVLSRPHWLSVPTIALRLILGEMSTLVVEGQRVIPSKLLESGYSFRYVYLEDALADLLK